MTKFETFAGYTGSEMERAALVSGVFPTESALERTIKQQAAKVLARIAGYIDPAAVRGFATPTGASPC